MGIGLKLSNWQRGAKGSFSGMGRKLGRRRRRRRRISSYFEFFEAVGLIRGDKGLL